MFIEEKTIKNNKIMHSSTRFNQSSPPKFRNNKSNVSHGKNVSNKSTIFDDQMRSSLLQNPTELFNMGKLIDQQY